MSQWLLQVTKWTLDGICTLFFKEKDDEILSYRLTADGDGCMLIRQNDTTIVRVQDLPRLLEVTTFTALERHVVALAIREAEGRRSL